MRRPSSSPRRATSTHRQCSRHSGVTISQPRWHRTLDLRGIVTVESAVSSTAGSRGRPWCSARACPRTRPTHPLRIRSCNIRVKKSAPGAGEMREQCCAAQGGMTSVCLVLVCRRTVLPTITTSQFPCTRDDPAAPGVSPHDILQESQERQLKTKRYLYEPGWERRPHGGSAQRRTVPARASVQASLTCANEASLTRMESPVRKPRL